MAGQTAAQRGARLEQPAITEQLEILEAGNLTPARDEQPKIAKTSPKQGLQQETCHLNCALAHIADIFH